MSGGTITRKDLITDEGLEFGKEYAKNIEVAIEANKELIESAKALNIIAGQYQKILSTQQYTALKQQETLETTKAMNAIKLEAEALKAAEKTKQESLRTRKLELDAMAKEEAAKKRNTSLTIEERVQNEINNRALKQAALEKLGLVSAYDKLNKARTEAKNKLRDLITVEGESSKSVKLAREEFDKLDAKVKRADRAVGDFTKNVGNYPTIGKLGASVKDLVGAFGLVGGIAAAVSVGKEVYSTVKELDTLNKSLKQITETEANYAKQKEFLRITSEKYGAEIKNLTKDYTSFYASTKGTNIEGLKTQKIFDSIIKSSTSLGKTNEETSGILLALSQMMSKGKVSSEELRGQLGERLPGAFKIMADSMGVTTAQLDKMLKNGEVISEKVLPKFAEQLEKTFGVENVNRIESIQSAQNRLSNSWTNFIEDNTGDLNQKLGNALGFIADNLQNIIKIVGIVTGAFLAYKATIIAIELAQKTYTATTVALRIAKIALTEGIAAARVQMTLFNATTSANPIGALIAVLVAAIGTWYAFSDAVDKSVESQKRLEEQTKRLKETQDQYNKKGDEYRNKRFKEIEDEIKLRKAKGENEKKLSEEEINRKKEVVQAEINSNSYLIEQSNIRIKQADKEKREVIELQNKILETKKEIAKFGTGSSVGKEVLKSELDNLEDLYNKKKLVNDLDKNKDVTQVKLLKDRNKELLDLTDSYNKEKEVKTAEELEKERKKRLAAAEKARTDYLNSLKRQEDDAYALQKFRLDRSVELNDEITSNEKASIQERIDAYLNSEKLKIASLDLTLEHEIISNELSKIDAKNTSIEKIKSIENEAKLKAKQLSDGVVLSDNASNAEKLIYEKYLNEKKLLSNKEVQDKQKIIDSIVAIEQKKTDKLLQQQDTELNKRLIEENQWFQEELKALKGNQQAIEDATKDHEERVKKIKEDALKQTLQNQIDAQRKLLENTQLSADVRADIENKLSKLELELNQIGVDSSIESNEKKKLSDEEYYKQVEEFASQLKDAIVDITNSLFDAKIQSIDNEIAKNEEYYSRQIELAGNDQAQKDLLQLESEKKRKKLEDEKRKEQQKQAIFNKAMQAAQISISTIGAVMSALRDVPKFDFGISASALAATYGVIGAAQLAAVLATPIPKYEKGTKGKPHKGGPALVGEKRAEVIQEPGMNPYVIDTPTILNLKKGTEVTPSIDEWNRLQRASILASLDLELNKSKSYQPVNQNYDMQLLEAKIENGIEKGFRKARITINNNQSNVDLAHELWKLQNQKWG